MTATTKHWARIEIETSIGSLEFADILRGTITLDQGKAPHIEAEFVIKRPTDTLYAALDPRMSPFVGISLFNGASPVRVFGLAVRSRAYVDGELTIRASSFESILTDYAPLVDDYTPLSLASSLRSVVNYVLQKSMPEELWVIGGLWPTPAIDADVTPHWSAVNMLRNPAVAGNLNNWGAGGGCTIAYAPITTSGEVAVTMTAGSAAVYAVDTSKYNVSCVPGETYTFSLVHKHTSASGGSAAVVLRFLDANNGVIQNVVGPAVSTTTSFERIAVTAVAPPSAVKIVAYWSVNGGTGRTFRLDGGMLYSGRFTVEPFTGGDAPSNGYTYEFEGPIHDSASIRTPDVERDPESLVWRAGQPALDFLLPLVQSAGYRLVNNGRWTLRDETYRASGSTTIEAGVNMVISTDRIDREARLWYDAQVTRYTWTDRDGIQREAIDAYALDPDDYRLVNVEEKEQPYPGPGYSEYSVRRAQERGHEVVVTAMTSWTTTAEQPITITLDDGIEQQGVIQSVEFDLELDEMTVTVRPEEETP